MEIWSEDRAYVLKMSSADAMHADVWDGVSNKHLFALRRNDYHSDRVVAVFRKVATQWRLVFQDGHEYLTVYTLPEGVKIFKHVRLRFEFLGTRGLFPIPVSDAVEASEPGSRGRFWWSWSWLWGPICGLHMLDMQVIAEHGLDFVHTWEMSKAHDRKLFALTDGDSTLANAWCPIRCIDGIEGSSGGAVQWPLTLHLDVDIEHPQWPEGGDDDDDDDGIHDGDEQASTHHDGALYRHADGSHDDALWFAIYSRNLLSQCTLAIYSRNTYALHRLQYILNTSTFWNTSTFQTLDNTVHTS